jgi:Tfp pilus assembly protein PilF
MEKEVEVMFKILSDFRLLRSLQHLKSGNILGSRKYLDKVLEVDHDYYVFLDAFDAIVMNAECRYDESLNRFEECLKSLNGKSDPDSNYIKYFCQFYECLYQGKGKQCAIYMEKALKLKTEKRVRMFLIFPPDLHGIGE